MSIRALAEHLGHADPGFTLRPYTDLMPSSEDRTRRAIDAAFRSSCASDVHQGPLTSVSAGQPRFPLDVVEM